MEWTFYWTGRHYIFLEFLLILFSLAISPPSLHATPKVAYRAAVCEHSQMGLSNNEIFVTRDQAVKNIERRLNEFENHTENAAAQGADIIVFPENGLIPQGLDRFSVSPYLEVIPDVGWNPSEKPRNASEIQYKLSDLAKTHKIYLVANVGSKMDCTIGNDPSCPSDGQHQYNSNVVYSDNGTLIAVYHKRNILVGSPFDPAEKAPYVPFETRFGRFAMVTGTDLILNEPTFALLKKYKIHNLILPSEWRKVTPIFRSLIIYSIFARANSLNLLVAGLHSLEKGSYGSGLFSPKGPKEYFYETHNEDANLLIADMEEIEEVTFRSKLYTKMDTSIISESRFLRGVMSSMMFHFKPLSERQGLVGICLSDFCCSLHYEMQQLNETYALGVSNGYIQPDYLRVVGNKFYAQICSLSKCQHPTNCIAKVTGVRTIFNKFTLTGYNFKSRNIGSNVLAMDGAHFKFVDKEWTYNNTGQIFVEKPMSLPLHSAVLCCRVYDKDFYPGDKHISVPHSANGNKPKPTSYAFMAMAILLCI